VVGPMCSVLLTRGVERGCWWDRSGVLQHRCERQLSRRLSTDRRQTLRHDEEQPVELPEESGLDGPDGPEGAANDLSEKSQLLVG
jgi:hypothetical protein